MTKLLLGTEQLSHAETSSIHYGALPEDLANFPGMVNLVAGSGAVLTPGAGTLTLSISGGGVGTVTSVGMTVPAFLSVSGSPVTTAGTLAVSYSGTALPIANGGTAATSAAAALTSLGAYPATNPSGYTSNTGTVTSAAVTGNNGISVSGSPITTSGTFTLGLGAITPTSVSTGALTASGAISLPAGSITRANLVNGTACTVIGRSANSTGAVADISMGTNDRLLGRVANVVGSTQLTAGMVPNSLITDAMLRNSAGFSVIGRTAGTTGAVADITATAGSQFLKSTAGGSAVVFEVQAAADLPGGNWITANSGMDYAASFTNITADSTWYDIGASVSLTPGTYLITSFCHGVLNKSTATNAGVISRLYDVTAGAAITSSECMILSDATAAWNGERTGTLTMIVTIGTTSTIRVEGSRITGGSYTQARISSNANGASGITYVRIY